MNLDVTIRKVDSGISRISSAFDKIKPTLEQRILKSTAVIAYHRPPINEDDEDIEKLKGLIFPPADLKMPSKYDERPGLHNRLIIFRVHKPKTPKVYLGVDVTARNPRAVLVYGFANIDECPQKIMQNTDGTFYLTRKPLLSGGNWMHPEVDFYIFAVSAALSGENRLI